MSGWIKFEKELINDPRVLRIASRLSHADVTQVSRNRLVVIGALVTLWSFADTHIRNDNTLEAGKDEVDAVIGIAGFCDLMPHDWLQVLDADRIQLPGFLGHNGIEAKKKALAQKRQERHRRNDTPPSRKRNASSVTTALPDLDLDLDLNQDQEKHTEARTKEAPRESESEEQIRLHVLAIKAIYPKASREDWITAEKLMRNLVSDGCPWHEIEAGVSRYQKLCKATHRIAQNPGLFFAAVDRPWLQEWPLPPSKAEAQRDSNVDVSREWLHATQ